MNLAWLDISITLVIIAHVVVSLLLILVILMQRPKQEGLGAAFGSGVTDAAWGARTTDVLQKGTVYLGTMFFVFSLVLAILMGKRNSEGLGKQADADGASTTAAAISDPIAPAAPETTKAEEMEKQLEALGTPGVPAETPEPVETPAPAETPEPAVVPEATETPAPTEAPESTETPAEAPAPAESPAPAEAPEPTEAPAPEGVSTEELPTAEETPAPAGE
ncbi:preprotein translocase subunit SecG [Verrucomicrobiaceae bacterium 227]